MSINAAAPSAAERAYGALKAEILDGTRSGGDLISEGEIASALGLSRTPVREAFLRLETEGWMKLYPKRGALIVPVGAAEATHVVQARFVVETGAVAALTPAVTESIATALDDSLQRQRDLAADGAVDDFATVDTDFHRTWVAAADNPVLLAFYDTLRERQQRMNAHSLRRDVTRIGDVIDDHESLADHVRRGDAAAFATTLADHLERVHGITLPGTTDPGDRS
ncbi:GntR family transcriptional regulator [Williamsia sterculiae]|uniref:Transcriptional regulator, GntR family n=1 Tax=Williamsia sterculiae TaxID=1344003 RepID=A0A1N7CGM4_9NOCA|nr:GntR family transcriptional regulator [Williamsia sterculiae]SIR62725.1 transcriptional regulator, GntR family [Williamsia sterculiae]